MGEALEEGDAGKHVFGRGRGGGGEGRGKGGRKEGSHEVLGRGEQGKGVRGVSGWCIPFAARRGQGTGSQGGDGVAFFSPESGTVPSAPMTLSKASLSLELRPPSVLSCFKSSGSEVRWERSVEGGGSGTTTKPALGRLLERPGLASIPGRDGGGG